MDRWDLIEQAFWDGTFDALGTDWPGLGSIVSQPKPKAPMTTRRKFLRGLGAAGMAAAGGVGGLTAQGIGEQNRWSEKYDRQRKNYPMLKNNEYGRWRARQGKASGEVNTPGAKAARAQNQKTLGPMSNHYRNEKAAPQPTAAGKLRSRRLFGGFGGGSGDTARDAPKSLVRRYQPITAVGGFPYQARQEARSTARGQEAKIESAAHKALNKYVPKIQRSQQMAQTRSEQGSPIKAGWHGWRAGRHARKAVNAINSAGFKHGGKVSPQSGQNVLAWGLNKKRAYGPTPELSER